MRSGKPTPAPVDAASHHAIPLEGQRGTATAEGTTVERLGDPDTAMLIDAIARRDADPMTRFIRSLPDDPPARLRSYAEDTVRLHAEFLQNVQCMLITSDPRESTNYAAWIAKNAHEVAYRWSALIQSVTRWSMYDVQSLSMRTGPYR